ncbi:hypothetical protein HDU84_001347 [Entophlyctis sp. JEL0112]|nr:hypothetical protein HDU84_001347 [Entophlyctis sp. JEL0112]
MATPPSAPPRAAHASASPSSGSAKNDGGSDSLGGGGEGTAAFQCSSNGRTSGYVKFFNAQKGVWYIRWNEGCSDCLLGYGFIIASSEREEVFVHHTAIFKPDGGFRSLMEGEDVEFDLLRGPKGLQAANVTGPGGAAVLGDPQAFHSHSAPAHTHGKATGGGSNYAHMVGGAPYRETGSSTGGGSASAPVHVPVYGNAVQPDVFDNSKGEVLKFFAHSIFPFLPTANSLTPQPRPFIAASLNPSAGQFIPHTQSAWPIPAPPGTSFAPYPYIFAAPQVSLAQPHLISAGVDHITSSAALPAEPPPSTATITDGGATSPPPSGIATPPDSDERNPSGITPGSTSGGGVSPVLSLRRASYAQQPHHVLPEHQQQHPPITIAPGMMHPAMYPQPMAQQFAFAGGYYAHPQQPYYFPALFPDQTGGGGNNGSGSDGPGMAAVSDRSSPEQVQAQMYGAPPGVGGYYFSYPAHPMQQQIPMGSQQIQQQQQAVLYPNTPQSTKMYSKKSRSQM